MTNKFKDLAQVVTFTLLLAAGVFLLALVGRSPALGCATDTECMEMHGGDGGPAIEESI
jgi:hypothetical protein